MVTAPTLHTTIAELIGGWPSARTVLARRGMACVGCSMASFETISEAAEAFYGTSTHTYTRKRKTE